MSIVVCDVLPGKIVMACDEQVTCYGDAKDLDWQKNYGWSKIAVCGDLVIGIVGYASELSLFLLFWSEKKLSGPLNERRVLEIMLEFREWRNKKTSSGLADIDSSVIFCDKKNAYLYAYSFVRPILDWCAIGSGYRYAEGAMEIWRNAGAAVSVAIKRDLYCGGRVLQYEADRETGNVLETIIHPYFSQKELT